MGNCVRQALNEVRFGSQSAARVGIEYVAGICAIDALTFEDETDLINFRLVFSRVRERTKKRSERHSASGRRAEFRDRTSGGHSLESIRAQPRRHDSVAAPNVISTVEPNVVRKITAS